MSDQKFYVTAQGDTLKILTGTLPTPLADRDERQQKTSFEGNISTPFILLTHPNKFYSTEKTVVTVDRQARTIIAQSAPGEAVDHFVKGVITLNKEFDELQIGKKNAFPQDEFWQFLKVDGKRFFPDASDLANLVGAVRGFKAKVEAVLQNEKDIKSNVNQIFSNKVEVDGFPDKIMVEAPIFKAAPPVNFFLDIAYKVVNNEVFFWFESSDYKKLLQDGVNELIDREITKIEEKGFTVIEK